MGSRRSWTASTPSPGPPPRRQLAGPGPRAVAVLRQAGGRAQHPTGRRRRPAHHRLPGPGPAAGGPGRPGARSVEVDGGGSSGRSWAPAWSTTSPSPPSRSCRGAGSRFPGELEADIALVHHSTKGFGAGLVQSSSGVDRQDGRHPGGHQPGEGSWPSPWRDDAAAINHGGPTTASNNRKGGHAHADLLPRGEL